MRTVLKYMVVLCVCLGYLLSVISPLVHPRYSELIYFAGLAFPIFMIAFASMVLYFALVHHKFIFLLSLIPGLIFSLNYVSLGIGRGDDTMDAITIYSLNAHSGSMMSSDNTDYQSWLSDEATEPHRADVLFIQESPMNTGLITHAASRMNAHNERMSHLNILTGSAQFNQGELKDDSGLRYAVYADMLFGHDTVRCYSFHLFSNRLAPMSDTVSVWVWAKNLVYNQSQIRQQLFEAACRRADQAMQIQRHMQRSPYPIIAAGDMNETSQSFTYRRISRGLVDAVQKARFGVHPTFRSNPRWVRIDYILVDPDFDILSLEVLPYRISDHRPLRAILRRVD